MIWVKHQSRGPSESILKRESYVHVLIHEFTQWLHMSTPHVAIDGRSRLLRNVVAVVTREGPIAENDRKLEKVRDEVEAVLYLGYESPDISYEDARIINKKILDMRLRQLYSNAMHSERYKMKRVGYWTTNHLEFFAEASLAFITDGGSFPSRDWIKANDPEIFNLLQEV